MSTPSAPSGCSQQPSSPPILAPQRNTRKRPLTSDVYEYFTRKKINEEVRHQCVSCPSNYSVNSATSTLRNHARKHGFLLGPTSQTVLSFDRKGQVLTDQRRNPTAEQQEKILRQLCCWIASSTQPFSAVENTEFVKLVRMFDMDFSLPNRRTISTKMTAIVDEQQINIQSQLASVPGAISLTTDAWSSKIYKGYVAVTAHWVDQYWCLRSVLLDFQRFPSPHTADATSALLCEIMDRWNITKKIHSITTDNASDVVSGINKVFLSLQLKKENGYLSTLKDFHIRCIAHVINIAVKDSLVLVHSQIAAVRNLVHACRCSVKRRDRFEEIKKVVGVNATLPCLDVETRWSSTFEMVHSATKAKLVFNAMCEQTPELSQYKISDFDWSHADKVCSFLGTAAAITSNQSGKSYVTLSFSLMAFRLLMKKCNSAIEDNGPLKPVATKIVDKLKNMRTCFVLKLLLLRKRLTPDSVQI